MRLIATVCPAEIGLEREVPFCEREHHESEILDG